MSDTDFAPPEFREWSVAAVRLLQGVVYCDDSATWEILLRSKTTLETYFSRLALMLIVDEPEGYAYLRQWADGEYPAGYEEVPKLMRRRSLGYGPTLLCVLLRDELRRFEDGDLHNERCVVEVSVLFEQWKAFFQAQQDEVRQHREFSAALKKVDDLGFVRKFSDEPEAWEIRRILKARLSVAELENLRVQLAGYRTGEAAAATEGDHDA